MNKGITLTILGVLLCAMSLVFYSHLDSPDPTPVVQGGSAAQDDSRTPPSGEAAPPAPGTSPAPVVPSVKAGAAELAAGQERGKPATQTPVTNGKPETKPAAKPAEKPAPPVAETKPPEPKPVTPTANDAPEASTVSVAEPAPVPEKPAEKPVEKPAEKPAEVKEAKPRLTPLASLSQTGNHTLKSIGLHFSGNQIFLRIEAGTAFPFSIFPLVAPDRLVIDLPGNWKGIQTPSVPSNQLVSNVRVGQQKKGPRYVVDLTRKPAGHELVRVSDTIIEIYFKE